MKITKLLIAIILLNFPLSLWSYCHDLQVKKLQLEGEAQANKCGHIPYALPCFNNATNEQTPESKIETAKTSENCKKNQELCKKNNYLMGDGPDCCKNYKDPNYCNQ